MAKIGIQSEQVPVSVQRVQSAPSPQTIPPVAMPSNMAQQTPAMPQAAAVTAKPEVAAISPIEAAGKQVDQARIMLADLLKQPNKPGLAAGRAAMDAYEAKVVAAKQLVARSESEYQQILPKQTAAFTRQKI